MPKTLDAKTRGRILVSLGLLILASLIFVTPAAGFATTTRVSGLDRYETAAAASRTAFPVGNWPAVVLVNGETFADSLSASSLAAKITGSLLLTTRFRLPESTRLEIARLGVSTVVVIGGPAAVDESIVTTLRDAGIPNVIRLAGSDRYETSVAVSNYGWPNGSGRVFLASGEDFGPGLVAGAAAGVLRLPLLITKANQSTASTESEIRRLSASAVDVVGFGGGFGKVADTVVQSLSANGIQVVQSWAPTLVELSVTVANKVRSEAAYFPNGKATLITADNFPDALAAGAIAGWYKIPLLMTRGQCLSPEINKAVKDLLVEQITIIGGEAAVSSKAAGGSLCSQVSSPPVTTTRPPATTQPPRQGTPPISSTQGLVYATYGCRNEIRLQPITYEGRATTPRVLVRTTRNVQLIPFAVNESPNVLLYGTFDCDAKTYSAFSQPISGQPVATRLFDLGQGMSLIDATWDIARDVPVFLFSSTLSYSIQSLSLGRWTTHWSGSRSSLGGFSADGFKSETGYEFSLWGNSSYGPSSTWKTWRVDSSGFASEELTGLGVINRLSSTSLGEADALITDRGAWVCDSSARGSITAAASQGKCVLASTKSGRDGELAYASNSAASFWLFLFPSGFEPPVRVKFECVGKTLFSCGRPTVRDSQTADFEGNSPHFRSLWDIQDVSSLGSTTLS